MVNSEISSLDMKFPLIKFTRENSIDAWPKLIFCSLLSSFRSWRTTEGLEGCQFTCTSSKDGLVSVKVFVKKE